MNAGIQGLCRGELSPEAFGDLLDKGIADAILSSELSIPKPVLFDPAALGEQVE